MQAKNQLLIEVTMLTSKLMISMLQGSIFFYLSIISQDLVSKKTCQKKVCVFLSESFFNCITTNPLSSHAEGASHPVEGPLFPIHH